MRIAIVGGTAAGPATAAEALRCNPEAEVVLYEKEPHISVGTCEIPYFASGWIEDWRHLEVLTPRQFEQSRGGVVKERHLVRSIDLRRRVLEVEALEFGSVHEEPFDRLVLTTGASPRRLDVDGEEAPNVFYIRSLVEVRELDAWLKRRPVRHAVMVGGGYIGLEMAEALRELGIRVTIIDPVGRVLGTWVSEEMGEPIDRAVHEHGVCVRRETPVRFDHDANGRVRAIHTDRGEVIGCDLVLISVGIVPNVDLAKSAGIRVTERGTVGVDELMQTSAAGVFACGDNVAIPHVGLRKPIYLPLATVARRAARVAARNAASGGRGGKDRFAPTVRILGVKAFGVEVAQVGISTGEAEAEGMDVVSTTIRHYSRTKIFPGSTPLWVRLIVERGTGRLLGGELVGEEGAGLRANTLVPLIREGYSARQVTNEIDLLYNPPMSPSVDPLLIACSQAAKAADTPVKQRTSSAGRYR